MGRSKRSASDAFGSSHRYKWLRVVDENKENAVPTYVSDSQTTRMNRIIFYNRESHDGKATKKSRRVKTSASNIKTVSTHNMHTRGKTTDAARNAVLNTPELLETIIIHLPIPNILLLRQVCHYWSIVIAKSPKIMEKLFIKAIPRPTSWVMDTKNHTLRPFNRLLENSASLQEKLRFLQSYPTILNPYFFKRQPGNEDSPLLYRAKLCESLRFAITPELMNRGSVYHSMFVSQPPVETVVLAIRYFKRRSRRSPLLVWDDETARIEVENTAGVRFRDILAAISATIQQRTGGCDEREFEIRTEGYKGSLIFMLGATFASDEEKKSVEKARVTEFLSDETAAFIHGMEREPSLDLRQSKKDLVEKKVVVPVESIAESVQKEIRMLLYGYP